MPRHGAALLSYLTQECVIAVELAAWPRLEVHSVRVLLRLEQCTSYVCPGMSYTGIRQSQACQGREPLNSGVRCLVARQPGGRARQFYSLPPGSLFRNLPPAPTILAAEAAHCEILSRGPPSFATTRNPSSRHGNFCFVEDGEGSDRRKVKIDTKRKKKSGFGFWGWWCLSDLAYWSQSTRYCSIPPPRRSPWTCISKSLNLMPLLSLEVPSSLKLPTAAGKQEPPKTRIYRIPPPSSAGLKVVFGGLWLSALGPFRNHQMA